MIPLERKDVVGFVLVAGTLTTLLIHGADRNQEVVTAGVADAGGSVTSADWQAPVAFVGVDVLTMTDEGFVRNQVVVVEDGAVRQMGPVGTIEPPALARTIEVQPGSVLMPGLTDAHVHIPDAQEETLPLFIANAVTTVFNLEGDERHLRLRERVLEGEIEGPNILTAGPFLAETNVPSVRAAEEVIEQHMASGFDFVKIHGRISETAYAALTSTARAAGLPVLGHAPRNLPFQAVLDHGQVGVAHAEELIYTHLTDLDESRLPALAGEIADAGVWITPTMTTFQAITEQWARPEGLEARLARPESQWLPGSIRERWETSGIYSSRQERGRARIEAMNAFHDPIVTALYEAGVPLLTGTDAPIPGIMPGFAIHDELAEFVSAGVPTASALEAATKNPGLFVQHVAPGAERFGVVEVGARADFVLVSGDPRGDLTLLRRPNGVMVRGRWYDREALDRLLSRSTQRVVADR